MKRNEWNLRPLFANDDDPAMGRMRKIVEQKGHAFITTWKNRRDYLKDPEVLRKALDEFEAWSRHYGTDGAEGYYFMLRTQQDQNSPALKAKYNKIEEFSRKIYNDIQFFHLKISKIPRGRQKRFLDFARLRKYRHFLERIFVESRYLLSEPEERIMNLKSHTSYSNWVRMTSSFLAKEERTVIAEDGTKCPGNFSEIQSLMNSKTKKVRDSAARAFNDILTTHVDVAEAELNSILANKKTDDEIRRMERPDLGRHISDDIETEVVDCLIRTVSDRFSIPRRFYNLKARLLKTKRLKYHERNVEYGTIAKHYTFTKSVGLVRKVLHNLDAAFVDIFDSLLRNGFIDAFPRRGKTSGAFCAHHLISQPTYLLLNHTGKLNDVLTLAHELGHGINNELMKEEQDSLNFGSPLSTAEVASTFMEDFVLGEILKQADDDLRLSIMMMKLNDDVSTIFRQVACYRFEQDLHKEFRQRGYLSKEQIGDLFRRHMAAYMGDAVEQSPGSENWWVYWSHIRSFFYVYSYASGLLISKSLQNSVKRDPAFIKKVKEFLSAGLSDSPSNIFRRLGIDIAEKAFWEKGLNEVERLLLETEGLARKLGRLG